MGRFSGFLGLLWVLAATPSAHAILLPAVHLLHSRKAHSVVWSGWVQRSPDRVPSSVETLRYPEKIFEDSPSSESETIEVIARDSKEMAAYLKRMGLLFTPPLQRSFSPGEVTTLVNNGPTENRLDLVFMGDGYTANEKDKFLEDVKRLTKDIFENQTFSSYLPLFNVHAVFVPSRESGIGVDDEPKDTAYGLVREGKTLRGIFSKRPLAIFNSCNQAPDCDYPIVVANDPFYGGLGGRYAITTSSPTSGSVVLRHELGHNFGKVGEEYDGGGYFGANYSASPSTVGWKHWLTQTPVQAEPSEPLALGWSWNNLAEGDHTIEFTSAGGMKSASIEISAAGVEKDGEISLDLDGQLFPIPSPGNADRFFYHLNFPTGFMKGRHTARFKQVAKDGNNLLAQTRVFEYGSGYHFDPDFVGAFPVFKKNLAKAGFRPTHGTCLMRDMESTRFCPVCEENIWLKFFGKISVIDDLKVTGLADGSAEVTVLTPALGHLRRPSRISNEALEIRWFKNGSALPALDGLATVKVAATDKNARWEVEVRFVTPEVRKDTYQLLKAQRKVKF